MFYYIFFIPLQIMKKILIFIFYICVTASLFAQHNDKANQMMDKAYEYSRKGNEKKCVETLLEITQKYPDFPDAYSALGQIYCSNDDYEKAIIFYEKGIEISPKHDLNSYYRLGKMYKQLANYTKAKQCFDFYVQNEKSAKYKERIAECKKELENIDFIQQSMANPVEFLPYNLGKNVNDTNYQYLPTLTLDEQLYVTQRENNKEKFYFCKRDTSQMENFVWLPKQKMPYPPNNDENVGAGTISPDGLYMYYAICGAKDGFGSCDIYVSKKEGDNTWSKPKNLGPNVNSSAWDSQPSIASDGRTLFFVSNRKGGYGKSDIYYTYLKDDGTWTVAKNLGSKINTEEDEISPFIHPSNTTLYFSSNGHKGMGGMDIFYSRINQGKFSDPVNIGYPINTSSDETCLVVSPDAIYAVYASDRFEDGEGKTDLYAFKLYPQARPTAVICMKGKVFYDGKTENKEAKFVIKNLKTNKIVAQTVSNKYNSSYLMTIPVDADYGLSVESEGYLFYSENFSISNDEVQKYYNKDIYLTSIKEGAVVVLQNIFFQTNSFELLETSLPELETLLQLLNDNPNIKIEISGHTDSEGNKDYNQTLSEKRANSVKQWLIEKGVKAERLQSKGYGQQFPIADNKTPEGRKQNRRTEFKIINSK